MKLNLQPLLKHLLALGTRDLFFVVLGMRNPVLEALLVEEMPASQSFGDKVSQCELFLAEEAKRAARAESLLVALFQVVQGHQRAQAFDPLVSAD